VAWPCTHSDPSHKAVDTWHILTWHAHGKVVLFLLDVDHVWHKIDSLTAKEHILLARGHDLQQAHRELWHQRQVAWATTDIEFVGTCWNMFDRWLVSFPFMLFKAGSSRPGQSKQVQFLVGCSRSTLIVFGAIFSCYMLLCTTLESHSMCRRITARVALWDWVWCARIECCIARCLQIS